jgi:hypothetical protein
MKLSERLLLGAEDGKSAFTGALPSYGGDRIVAHDLMHIPSLADPIRRTTHFRESDIVSQVPLAVPGLLPRGDDKGQKDLLLR